MNRDTCVQALGTAPRQTEKAALEHDVQGTHTCQNHLGKEGQTDPCPCFESHVRDVPLNTCPGHPNGTSEDCQPELPGTRDR